MIHRTPAALVFALVAALGFLGCNSNTLKISSQKQPSCDLPKQLNAVGDCVQCILNSDCTVGQQCNLLSGTCEAVPPIPDGGFPLPTCGIGAVRCAPDGQAVQTCVGLDGGNGWNDSTECVGGEVCNPTTLTCAICVPGETVCAPDAGVDGLFTCSDDGTTYNLSSCNNVDAGAVGYTCQQVVPHLPSTDGGLPQSALATCQLCVPNSSFCSVNADGGAGVNICNSTGTVLEFESCYPTNVCLTDGGSEFPNYCQPYICLPGQANCNFDDGGAPASFTATARQICNSNGTAFTDSPCQPDATSGQPTVCGTQGTNNGACLTPCQQVESSSSYFGCDYWGTLLSNSQLAQLYTGNSSNQSPGTTPSDFAFVVSNTNATLTANVTVSMNGLTPITATIAPNSVVPINLPWRPICGTGLANFGYHLTSDVPVTVYQFNPLHSSLSENTSCNSAFDCPNIQLDVCNNGQCFEDSYSNDASLLLPTHLLGTSYVVAAYNQISEGSNGNASDPGLPGEFAIVATNDNTHVLVTFSGTAASTADNGGHNGACPTVQGNLPGQTAGAVVPYTLSKGQVLQFWGANVGNPTCQPSMNEGDTVCLYPNDFTGTVVSSVPGPGGSGDGGIGNSPAQPIAVFGGADCTYVPYNQVACDHIEEEMFPFNTWGKTYVGVKTKSYTGASMAYPDFFRLISACGPNSCPNGAKVTFTPEIPLGVDQNGNPLETYSIPNSNWCSNSNGSTVCTLPPLTSGQTAPWMSFQTGASFYAFSDQPVSMAQYLVSETEAGSSSTEGDPDILLLPPIEQWRTTYTVLAPNTFLDNYLDMVVQQSATTDPNATSEVLVDGAAIPASEWNNIPNTPYYAANHRVCGRNDSNCSGSHTISSPNQVGVTISGYDSYVTYSYTGGLDLQTITEIVPGG